MEKLKSAERLEENVKNLTQVVTSLQEKLKAQPATSAASYAEMAGGRLPRTLQVLNGQQRPGRSLSTKRGRSNELDGGSQRLSAKQRKTLGDDELEQAALRREEHPAAAGSALSQDLQGFKNADGACVNE